MCPHWNRRGHVPHRRLFSLVTKPLQRYDRLSGTTGDLNKHLETEYHKRSQTKSQPVFLANQAKGSNVYKIMNSHHRQTCEENCKRLRPIIETIVFCGQNNIALRGQWSCEFRCSGKRRGEF